MNLLLQEDDCALDAREYFIKKMKEEFGLNFRDFFDKGMEIDDLCIQHKLNDCILEYNGDDPYYRLYKVSKEQK